MKNYSKNNSSKNNYSKSNNKNKNNHSSKYPNSSEEEKFSMRNTGSNRKSSKNKNESYQSLSRNKNEKNYLFSKSKDHTNNFPKDLYIINDKYKNSLNKKNFEDWIWGKHSVIAALNNNRAINRIWCTSEIFSSEKFYTSLKDLKSKGVLIEEVSWNRISQLTFGANHQGVAIQLAYSETISLNKLIDLSKANSKFPVILALDGITDPHNLGAIIRSAEAFDCKGIVLPQRRSAGLTGTVAKVAAGALEHIPVSRVVNLNRALEELKRNGFLTVGLTGNGNISISKFNENYPLVLIIGAEDKGISLLTQKKCDYLVRIPLKGKTSSLNASVAASIAMFHFTKK